MTFIRTDTVSRLAVFAGTVMSSIASCAMFLQPEAFSDGNVTALVMMALAVSSVIVGSLLFEREDRSLGLGVMFGVPFAFFLMQQHYASLHGDFAVAAGAGRLMATSSLLVLVSSGIALYVRRRQAAKD